MPDEPTLAVIEQATDWHLLLQSGEATATDRAACKAWRARHPSHELAWQRMQALWQQFDAAEPPPAQAALDAACRIQPKPKSRRSRRALAGGALLLAGLAGGASFTLPPPAVLLADHRSATGERRSIELPDRSRLVLDSDSAVDLRYDGSQRRIVLHRGGVLAEVAADTQAAPRPFSIETPQSSARALGTRYTVRREADGNTMVSVLESIVEACAQAAPPASGCVRLHPGQQVRIGADGPGAITGIDAAAEDARMRGQLIVDDLPLSEVLLTLGRHRPGLLRYDAAALAGIRVSGVFPLDDTDRALDALARTLSLRVRHYTPWLVIVDLPDPA
ncbi:FecR family protein [Thauera linaloolentis]|uniref:Fe2+-dicitrate sensor, membrane protein n=1 Tax=Thauera linaloolentis (strain DSM 12138 / JCM 21573 / CCUG 41526 / CIP 105981 / IAM 15112 / NBRC 102519 / 47Lol) TaxID=1123367 RepID=N6YY63_THAL4|nr:FecR family protein [Thauera linaloolentis]ENO87093.1 Fe2+-dicitrate sensor, membrane protein [Thauera linaloolentis 47Lol = DSM 12138]